MSWKTLQHLMEDVMEMLQHLVGALQSVKNGVQTMYGYQPGPWLRSQETSAILLGWCSAMLAHEPDVQVAAAAEVRAVLGDRAPVAADVRCCGMPVAAAFEASSHQSCLARLTRVGVCIAILIAILILEQFRNTGTFQGRFRDSQPAVAVAAEVVSRSG